MTNLLPVCARNLLDCKYYYIRKMWSTVGVFCVVSAVIAVYGLKRGLKRRKPKLTRLEDAILQELVNRLDTLEKATIDEIIPRHVRHYQEDACRQIDAAFISAYEQGNFAKFNDAPLNALYATACDNIRNRPIRAALT